MFQIAIDINELIYGDLPTKTLADRIKKAKLILDITQEELAEKTGLSRHTICELEAGYRDNILVDTIEKLISVLDPNIILDDYLKFILNQELNMKSLVSKYGKNKILEVLNCHRSTLDRYLNNSTKLPKNKYYILKSYLK